MKKVKIKGKEYIKCACECDIVNRKAIKEAEKIAKDTVKAK